MVFCTRKVRLSKFRVNRENLKRKSSDTPCDILCPSIREDSCYNSIHPVKQARVSQLKSIGNSHYTSRISKLKGTQISTSLSSINSQGNVRRRINFTDSIIQKYLDSINQQADTLCEICCRLVYSEGTRKMNSVPIIVEASLNDHFRSLKREQNSAFQDIKRILSNSAEPLCLLGGSFA